METQPNTENKKIKLDFKESKYATGRRKTSIPKVWLKKGSGCAGASFKRAHRHQRSAHYESCVHTRKKPGLPADNPNPWSFTSNQYRQRT